jgi:hypothetical protein
MVGMKIWPALLALLVSLPSCITYQEELARGERHFDQSEYERALAVFRALETDMDSLGPMDRSRYAYLRGMTDYRLSFRADARHWLAIARECDQKSPGGLSDPWKARLSEALKDLNQDVYGGGPQPAGRVADGG